MSKSLDLAKKLQALAVGGVGGEKDNAARLLVELCRKHGIRVEDLEKPATTLRRFGFTSPRYQAFLAQCLGSTTRAKIFAVGNPATSLEAELTDAEYVEIKAKADFYWPIWQREENTFFSAFIQKNGLGALPGGQGREPSAQELAEIRRKASGMDAHQMNHHLGPRR